MIVFGAIFGIAILITGYYAFALMFHWLRYGFMYPMVWLAIPTYVIGTGLLLLVSLAALSGIN